MKHIILLIAILFVGCSKEPKEMEAVLFERSGQWITNDDYSSFFFFNRKVYNGPAFNRYRSGEKREEGMLKNGFKSGIWIGWDKEGKKKFSGEYEKGKAHGKWTGYHLNGERKYEGLYEQGFQTGKWAYYNEQGKKTLEEIYYECDEKCEDEHPPNRRGATYICEKLGRIKETKKL